MKKTLTLLLALVMLLGVLASCNNGKNTEEMTTVADQTLEDEPDYLDSLPPLDLKNEQFNILFTSQTEDFYMHYDYSGDIVGNAAYERNLCVEERFKTELNYIPKDGNSSGSVAFNNAIRTSMNAGEDAYDLILGQSYYCLSLATEGMYYDLNTTEYLNLENEWYHSEINRYGVVNNKRWAASGDFILSQIGWALSVAYNKDVVTAYFSDWDYDLYDLVREGKWTYERFYEMSTAFGSHNGNDNDMYAFSYGNHTISGLMIGFGVDYVTQNENGDWSILDFYDDHLIDAYNKVYDLCFNHDAIFLGDDVNNPGPASFDNLLFVIDYIHGLTANEWVTENIQKVGVLPMPKLNEAQSYRTYVQRNELFYIPITADLKASAIITDALNQKTNEIVIPEYFGKVLQLQSAQSSEDSEMLGLIRETLHYDFALFYNEATNYMVDSVSTYLMAGNDSVTGWWAKNWESLEYQIGKIPLKYAG